MSYHSPSLNWVKTKVDSRCLTSLCECHFKKPIFHCLKTKDNTLVLAQFEEDQALACQLGRG